MFVIPLSFGVYGLHTFSLEYNFAPFLIDMVTWLEKTAAAPLLGLENDTEEVHVVKRRTAAQMVTQLEPFLGPVVNYCPMISRNTMVKSSTSLNTMWQAIRTHVGFQSTGTHFLDFGNTNLELDERTGNLYQRLVRFIDDTN